MRSTEAGPQTAYELPSSSTPSQQVGSDAEAVGKYLKVTYVGLQLRLQVVTD